MFGDYTNMAGFNIYLQLAGVATTPGSGGGNVQECRLHEEMDDDFLMYVYKVRRCPKTKSHDWITCLNAHRGEKARRRDPRKFPYTGVACQEFRSTGECKLGQKCGYAHGVFELWLHPSRYRTRPCDAGVRCPRRICFFAHTPEQLRLDVAEEYCCTHNTSNGHESSNNKWKTIEDGKFSFSPSPSAPIPIVEHYQGGVHNDMYEPNQSTDQPNIDWVIDLVN